MMMMIRKVLWLAIYASALVVLVLGLMIANDLPRSSVYQGPHNKSIVLTHNNKRMGYDQYGNLDSDRIMVLFHGSPGSRVVRLGDETMKQKNIRVIVPERPGYGISDYYEYENHTRISYCRDNIVQLLDKELQIPKDKKVALVGISGGGPFAATCAHVLGAQGRVASLALISSVGPLIEGNLSFAGSFSASLDHIEGTPFMTFYFWLLRQFSYYLAEYMWEHYRDGIHPPDLRVLLDDTTRQTLLADSFEGFRPGYSGFAYDFSLAYKPWGFSVKDDLGRNCCGGPNDGTPKSIPKALIWHGDRDQNVPLAHTQYLCSAIPEAQCRIFPDAGHVFIAEHMDELCDELLF